MDIHNSVHGYRAGVLDYEAGVQSEPAAGDVYYYYSSVGTDAGIQHLLIYSGD